MTELVARQLHRPLPKVQAGGIVRTSLDNSWRTPEWLADRARVYFGGGIPFDAATGPENPMRAARFCMGRLDSVPPLTWKDAAGKLQVEPEEETRARGRERRRAFLMGLARGADLAQEPPRAGEIPVRAWVDGRPAQATLETFEAERREQMPFCSGLSIRWEWPTWVNPPYGRELKPWLAKITDEARSGVEVVGLLPCARWEQRYFQKVLRASNALCLIVSRVAFISSIDHVPVGGNPYASMLIGWNVDPGRWLEAFKPIGACFDVRPMRRRRHSPTNRLPAGAAAPLALSLFPADGGGPC